MELADLLVPGAVFAGVKASSKKQLLSHLAAQASKLIGLDERRILEAILERERLGSTGLGGGVAIPHAKLPSLQSVVGLFMQLETPIDFDSLDGKPVDLIFLLLAPEDAGAEHLRALASVSRLFRDQAAVAKLRGSSTSDALYALLASHGQQKAA
ncbi:PTS IIA-like nitrogen regulatory protein PtsN [Pedomonas mirosovicensis]|uniref:PTS IIA-like nitrogen regulatory protein PtsN n=1 Tax=Pedomonas mirosovicensis TaxID=2908641 RepID=UPI002166F186|nr:PTS IIA-like nitrogen regulatory protein PtsN [Pedomonas mirosovicensis]MCH8684059.1 PTS IIA-like nitrogen regulatory protein PtsN [Pedomonas mirosovicensis]